MKRLQFLIPDTAESKLSSRRKPKKNRRKLWSKFRTEGRSGEEGGQKNVEKVRPFHFLRQKIREKGR